MEGDSNAEKDQKISFSEGLHIAWDISLYNLDLATDLIYVLSTQFYNDHYRRASVFFIAIPLIIQVIIGPLYNRVTNQHKSKLQKFKEAVILTFGGAPYLYRNVDQDTLLHLNKTTNAYYQDMPQFFIQLLNNLMVGTGWTLIMQLSPIISSICTFNKLSRPLQGLKCKGSEFICYVFMIPVTIIFMMLFSKNEEGLTDEYGAEY